MEYTSNSGAMRLGPLARRLLARRRRWLRWAALALAALTILSALAQLRHRPAPARQAPSKGDAVRSPASASRFYGVAAEVPPGMRAVNLVLPAAATFGGRLVPLSRVDLLAAFDLGQDRAVQRVLASGIVLHVTSHSAASATGTAAPPLPEGRLGPPSAAEVSIAVPAAREREVVMAQAFGRVFAAVAPAGSGLPVGGAGAWPHDCAGVPAPVPAGPLSLRHYLGLSEATGPSHSPVIPAFLPAPPGLPPVPGLPWPRGLMLGPSTAPPSPRGAAPSPDAHHGGLAVEVIEGTARTVAEVTP